MIWHNWHKTQGCPSNNCRQLKEKQTMKAILALLLALVVLAVPALAGQPTDQISTNIQYSPLVSPIMTGNKHVDFGIGAQLHLNPGSYFNDEGYRSSYFFVPHAVIGFASTSNSNAALSWNFAYPDWTKYEASGSATLTSSAGADLACSGVASGQGVALCMGNVLAFNVASGQPCVFEAKVSVPTFTSTLGAAFVGLGSAVGTTTSSSPAWSTTATTYGPAQVIGLTLTGSSGSTKCYLGYAVYSATDSRAIITVTSVTVSQTDALQLRIDATTSTNVQLKYCLNAGPWQTLYQFDATPFTTPLQPVIQVAKQADASVVDLRVRYIKLQLLQP
jgi:hypothetical protein